MTLAGRAVVVRRAAAREILALRHAELRPGLPLATANFNGDDDASTFHFGVFDAATGEALCCASLMAAAYDGAAAYQLRGMATRRDLVRQGLGAALLKHSEQSAAAAGIALLWCNARIAAAPFYQRHGWVIVSEVFDIPDVGPHYKMTRQPGARSAL